MKQILKMNDLVEKVLGDQIVDSEEKLRPIAFHVTTPVKDGTLLFHVMTKEMLLLNDDELKSLYSESGSVTMRDYLIRHWFLVPEAHDDCLLSDEICEIARELESNKLNGKKTRFTIFTTTKCNARCYYCFEKGYKTESMTDDTAHRVAQYILRNRDLEKPVRIAWFGGEPLYNSRAIDIISSDLMKADCEFSSNITTNGYLFDEGTIGKAVQDWHTDLVQISIDGTEEIYNRTKAYIYKDDPSPFNTVLDNIKNLLKAGISVHVRLNTSPANIEDMEKLSVLLKEELGGIGNLLVYSQRLYQILGRCAAGELESFRRRDQMLSASLNREGLGGETRTAFENLIHVNRCTADNREAVVILTDGTLTKCQHLGMGPDVGNIDNDIWDEEAVDEWCAVKNRESLCSLCVKYPDCFWLTHCEPLQKDTCTPISIQEHMEIYRRRMEKTYRGSLAIKERTS